MLVNDPDVKEIYVRIIDEFTELWKPVSVKWVKPFQYEILCPYDIDCDSEILEFANGEIVHGLYILSKNNSNFIGAIRSYVGRDRAYFYALRTFFRKNGP